MIFNMSSEIGNKIWYAKNKTFLQQQFYDQHDNKKKGPRSPKSHSLQKKAWRMKFWNPILFLLVNWEKCLILYYSSLFEIGILLHGRFNQ